MGKKIVPLPDIFLSPISVNLGQTKNKTINAIDVQLKVDPQKLGIKKETFSNF